MQVFVLDAGRADCSLRVAHLNILAEDFAEVVQAGPVIDAGGAERAALIELGSTAGRGAPASFAGSAANRAAPARADTDADADARADP